MYSNYSKRLFFNFSALGFVQGANFLLPIIIIPYVIARIGADGFGTVSVAQVVIMFFTNIADYGFNLTGTRDVALNKENNDVLSKIFFTILATRLVICILLFAILLLSILIVPIINANSTLYLLAFVSVIGQSLLTNWLFQGIEKMNLVLYISLLARLVFIVLVVLFIREKNDHIYFIFFSGLGNILAGFLSIITAYKLLRLKRVFPSAKDILQELKKGWHITASNLSVSVYMYANILILRFFTNDTVVGYYSVAERVIFAARQVLSVYFQAIYPQVCQLAVKSKEELSLFFMKYYRPFLACVLVGCCGLFFFADPVVSLFLSGHNTVSADYLRILSLVPFIVCLNIPAYQVLLVHNEKKILLMIFTLGTIVNIALSLLFIPAMGALGTTYIVLITEFLITMALILAMVKNQKTRVRFVV